MDNIFKWPALFLGKGTKKEGEVFVVGCRPALQFGAELSIASKHHIKQARTWALKASAAFVPGGHSGTLASMEKLGWDIGVRFDEAPLRRYCEER